jgi:SET domain
VATKFISRGSNIFTEKAAYVTQLPLQSDNVGKTNYWDSSPFAVRACQYCFRSLEPVSSCRANSSDLLPMPSLWPVPQYEQTAAEPGDSTFRRDKHGRLQCTECNSLFCSTNCRDKHEWQMTSCCQCINAMNTVLEILSPHVEKDAVIMASRIFCAMLTAYRKLPLEKIADEVEALCDLEGLCGNASDIEPLELGVISRSDAGQIQFSLLPVYNALCSNVYVMTAQERTDLSLELFSRLSAISGRNGFCVRTESPFRPYHSALLRAAGGRGSERHLAWMNEVAHALGSETLQRTMDREVEDLVCVQVVAIFSLTARMNHSCDPNAEVRSQQYVDCCIDVVAKRDIQPGEEITISYINNEGRTGSSLHDRNRRLRELKAKYLFTCDCHRCAIDQSRRSSNVPYA